MQRRTQHQSAPRQALVVGATGIAGQALMAQLASEPGWETVGLSRGKVRIPEGARLIRADLGDPAAIAQALNGLNPSHIFFTAWKRHRTEAENISGNSAMVRNLIEAAGAGGSLQHVALLTGLKHYIGSPEHQGKIPIPDTPFLEDSPRRDSPNFYYAQEDELFAGAERFGYTWSVHRAHTIVGHAVGNAMNMALTLAAYAAICRERGTPFHFPGSRIRWEGLGDMSSADLIADHMIWASGEELVHNTALNIVNGDVFRWRAMWPKLAELLNVEPAGFENEPFTLTKQMEGAEDDWARIAARHNLVEQDIRRVASWWHTDGDLGRTNEMLADMSRSRLAGYCGYRRTVDSFKATFDAYVASKVLPPPRN